jgi:hypothetical protein
VREVYDTYSAGSIAVILTHTVSTDPAERVSSVPSPEGGDRSSFTNVFFGILHDERNPNPSNLVESLLFIRFISCHERIQVTNRGYLGL